jgi:hypothetical protein
MKRIVKLTERDLTRLVNKVIKEQEDDDDGDGFNSGNPIFDKIEKSLYTFFGEAGDNLNEEELEELADTMVALIDQEWGLNVSYSKNFINRRF